MPLRALCASFTLHPIAKSQAGCARAEQAEMNEPFLTLSGEWLDLERFMSVWAQRTLLLYQFFLRYLNLWEFFQPILIGESLLPGDTLRAANPPPEADERSQIRVYEVIRKVEQF